MKLKNLVISIVGDKEDQNIVGLENIREQILQCDEFSETKNLIIANSPAFNCLGKVITCTSWKALEDFKFKGTVCLYALSLTPVVYRAEDLFDIPLDKIGAISPIIYHPDNYEPTKKIILSFSPDSSVLEKKGVKNETQLRAMLHKNLDIILDNTKEFQPEGYKALIIRGYFPETLEQFCTVNLK